MIKAASYWITIAEVKEFSGHAASVFTMAEWEALSQCISMNPAYGEVIPDTGGVRVVKWPAESQGRNGHVRVIYYFRDLNMPLVMIAIFERGERLNLSSADKRIIRELVDDLVASYLPGVSSRVIPGGAA